METKTDAVVVPAIPLGSSVCCLRSLGRHNVRTIGLAHSKRAPPISSKYCSEWVQVPAPEDDLEGYRKALHSCAERSDVVTIVPLREADIYLLSKYRDEFGTHVETPWKRHDAIQNVQDNKRLFEIADRIGIPTPETGTADEWEDWTGWTIIKSRYSIVVDDNKSHPSDVEFNAPGSAPDLGRIISEMSHTPVIQEYIPGGPEYGFEALFDEGTPVVTFQHRRHRSFQYWGGASVFRTSVDIPALETAGLKLLSELDWHGPAMVEFKRDERDGEYKLLEVNPRFWGSLTLPYHAGVDFPYLYYLLASNGGFGDVPDYEVGVGSHILRGEVGHLASLLQENSGPAAKPSLPSELANVLVSLVTHPKFDFFSLDDPAPFVRDTVNWGRDLLDR